MSCVASDRFRCLSLNVFFSDLLHQVIFFRPEMYIKKTFKWCYLLNDFSAFIFHSNVHLLSSTFWHMLIWVVLRNCVPLGVGNFKLVFEGNLLLQCKYFYFLSLHVDVSDNKNNNDCQSCVLCILNRTDVAKWIKNGATDLWHRQHHWKECIRNFIKNHTVTTHLTSDDHIKCIS